MYICAGCGRKIQSAVSRGNLPYCYPCANKVGR